MNALQRYKERVKGKITVNRIKTLDTNSFLLVLKGIDEADSTGPVMETCLNGPERTD
jgi:hypothetical protein